MTPQRASVGWMCVVRVCDLRLGPCPRPRRAMPPLRVGNGA